MVLTLKQGKIIVKTERDITILQSKVDQILREIEQFSILDLITRINVEIVDPIQSQMRNIPVSAKIIDSTYLSNDVKVTGNIATFTIISDYIAEGGFPVSVMIEEGREPYTVLPKPPTPERPDPHLKFIKNGVTTFQRKSKIPRYPARQIIKNTIKDKIPTVQKGYNKSVTKWIKSILRG